VFLANWSEGLHAYIYDGGSFTKTAQINDGGTAGSVAIATDGTILLASWFGGLYAYRYNGNSFTNISHINNGNSAVDVVVGSDDIIFLANGLDGLRAFSLENSSFSSVANIYDGGIALGVTISSDGTIFLANGEYGLRSYSFDGSSFTNTAYVNDGGRAEKVSVAANGTVFLANREEGLLAYHYSAIQGLEENIYPHSERFSLFQNYPNPFNPRTHIEFDVSESNWVKLNIYNLQGHLVTTLVNQKLNPGRHKATFSRKDLASGIYLYQIKVGDFQEAKKMLLLQ